MNTPKAAPGGWREDATVRKWLVWSNEHNAWWRPNSQGYTYHIEAAGRYTEAEADACCTVRDYDGKGTPPEVKRLAPEFASPPPEDKGRADIAAEVGPCPICSGDCASANPPVMFCPMQALQAAETALAASRAEVDGAEKVFDAICDALGCEHDNDIAISTAAHLISALAASRAEIERLKEGLYHGKDWDDLKAERDASRAEVERWQDVLMSLASRLELPRSESGPPDNPLVYERAIDGLEQLYTDELKRRQEAETKLFSEPSASRAQVDALVGALTRAQAFIRNGRELGFIRMPDPSTPDPAHETPGIIDAALAAHRSGSAKGGE